MFTFFVSSALLVHKLAQEYYNIPPILVIDKTTKELVLSTDPRFKDFLSKTYTQGTNQCLGLYPSNKEDHFLIKGTHNIVDGVVKSIEKNNTLELNVLYASNYVLVPNEPFMRIDLRPTKVDERELKQKDDGKFLEFSTKVEMSHRDMSKDVTNAECAGEIRYIVKAITDDGSYIVQLTQTNLQSSVFDYPEYPICLQTLTRLGIRTNLYRNNTWEVKGREKKQKK